MTSKVFRSAVGAAAVKSLSFALVGCGDDPLSPPGPLLRRRRFDLRRGTGGVFDCGTAEEDGPVTSSCSKTQPIVNRRVCRTLGCLLQAIPGRHGAFWNRRVEGY